MQSQHHSPGTPLAGTPLQQIASHIQMLPASPKHQQSQNRDRGTLLFPLGYARPRWETGHCTTGGPDTHHNNKSYIYIYRLVRKRSHIGKEVVAMRRSMRQNRLHKYINTLPGTATQNILMLFTMEETPERQAETIGTKMETKRVNINQLAKPTKSKRGSIHK